MLPILLASALTVALTFDDIPGVALPSSHCEPASTLRWNRKLLATLKAHRAPALGLVVSSRSCESIGPIFNAWLDAGHDLGNHTYSHIDLNRTPVADYETDIVNGEAPLRTMLTSRGKTLKYFRHPMLHAGDTAAKKERIDSFLTRRGYTIAPVTIDNQDYLFANAYSNAIERNDRALAKRIAGEYIRYMQSVIEFFERRTVAVVGRPIPHVILLHMNGLNADHGDALLTMLEKRGYRFITVDEALRDPAYALADKYIGPRGVSWIHRWGVGKGMKIVEEPREPEWIAEAAR